ncbi:MAG: uroporphyrinogen decarboxylase family protein [Caldilineaceae bacterium]
MNGRQRILAHLAGEPVDCLPAMPITMTFAARGIGAPYQEYCTDYRVQVEGQIWVADTYDVDYVSAISDPAVEATDCGAPTVFFPDDPPANNGQTPLLGDKDLLAHLPQPGIKTNGRMENRLAVISGLKQRVGERKLVEGWIEGPCAEAADLRGINNLMLDFYDDPEFVERLFEFVLAMELDFAAAQIAAGADLIGIGDAAASLVGPHVYEQFVWPFEQRMVAGVHRLGARVRLHICGNTRRILGGMGTLGCEIVDLDFLAPLDEGRAAMGPSQVLLGNIAPVRDLRGGTPESVYAIMDTCHRQAGDRYIVGAGCEVPRDTPDENLRALVRYARDHVPHPSTT